MTSNGCLVATSAFAFGSLDTVQTQAFISQDTRSMTLPAKTKAPKKAAAKKRTTKFVWRKRDAQDSQFYNLQLDINDLKQSIQELTQHRELLYARQLNQPENRDGSFVRIVAEYLRVFRNGIDASPINVVPFLQQIMADSVWINEFRGGVEMMVAQWKVYSVCFATIDLRYIDSIVLPIEDAFGRAGVVVRAHARYSARITQHTISIMFPHLLRFPDIVDQLLGKFLRGSSHYDFVFDCHSGRVVRCDVTLDFFMAFSKLLPNPHDLSIVFNGAKVESGFYLGDGDDSPIVDGPLVDEKPFKDVPPPFAYADDDTGTRPAQETAMPCDKMGLRHILS